MTKLPISGRLNYNRVYSLLLFVADFHWSCGDFFLFMWEVLQWKKLRSVVLCIVIFFLSVGLSAVKEQSAKADPHCFEWNNATKTFEKKRLTLPPDAPSFDPGFWTRAGTGKYRSRSHPKAQQDNIVLLLFDDMGGGFFLDVGAGDPETESNTYVLEYYNKWGGVCVEPDQKHSVQLLARRKCSLFVNPASSVAGRYVHYIPDGAEAKKRTALSVSLSDILTFTHAPNIIQYLSINTNGMDFLALESLNFDRYTFLCITVQRPKSKLHSLLVRNGFVFVRSLSGERGDILYLHHTYPKLREVMKEQYTPYIAPQWDGHGRGYLLVPAWLGYYRPFHSLGPLQPPDES